jgi:hypothetical protein
MPNTVVVSVGADITNAGKFYWDIKTAALDPIYVRKEFETLEDAKADLEEFRRDLANAVILENLSSSATTKPC